MSERPANFLLEPERYEFRERRRHTFHLKRRTFLKVFGGGIAVFAVSRELFAMQESGRGRGFRGEELPKEISAWLHIGEDGRVTAFTGKVEVGQNARTSLTQSVADELRVPFASVKMVMGDTALTPYDMGTFGSRTTPTMMPQLRRVAAAARELLVEVAAKEWNVAPEKLTAADARVSDPASGKSATYAELARGKTLAQAIPEEDPITPASEWTIAGKPIPKVDGRDFVTGRHQYTPDLRPEGVLYGKVLRPAAFGATLVSFDGTKAEAMPGVTVVRDGDFAGVAAPDEATAMKALAAIRAEWKAEPQISNKELFTYLKQNAETGGERNGRETGSIETGMALAAHRLEETYTIAYIAHAPLEPRAAVAEWNDGKLTAWTGTQRPFGVRDELCEAFHLPAASVRVIMPDTGAAYGGKHTGEEAV
ncbi:MAG: molybdopterin cofactor-binding domain-containing protein, partial [Steroidobacteraceae bacterium]